MFSALRESSPFYILRKGDKPELQTGQVVSVSQPKTKYGTTPMIGQYGIETTVDVTVKVNDETVDFKQLPSNLEIANFGNNGIVVSESRNAMLCEVEAMLRNSKSILDSMDYHKSVIEVCELMQKELNPQLRLELEREDKISNLESKIGGMEDSISQLKDMLYKALGAVVKN